ncbi:2657_t:CDS:1, partial [Ambispora leptoticha]
IMNLDWYHELYQYLDTDTIPEDFTKNQKKQLINQARYFRLDTTYFTKRIEWIQTNLY